MYIIMHVRHTMVLHVVVHLLFLLSQNGKQAFWDCVKMHDRYHLYIYNYYYI